MSNLFKSFIISTFSLLTIFVIGCKEDEEVSAYDQLKPSIAEISAEEGLRGTSITLTGTNLDEVDKVIFGNQEATFTATETTVTATVPDGVATGELNIAVYSPHGSERISFIVTSEPKISQLSVAEGFHGDEVIITGTAFADVSMVTFGDVEAGFTSTETTIITHVPAEASYGEVTITLTNDAGSSQTPFTVRDEPVVFSFSPASGAVGDEIIINGINFIEVQKVLVGETEAEFMVNDLTDITFTVPEGALNGVVTVETAAGTSSSEDNFIVQTGEVLPFILYDDALNGGWQQWGGWGTDAQEMANTEQPKSGSNAIKIVYNDAYGALQLHPLDATVFVGYSTVILSIYGGAGSDGTTIALQVKDSGGAFSSEPTMTIKEGEYTTFEIPISDLGNPASVAELFIKNYGTAPNTIYIDDIELR